MTLNFMQEKKEADFRYGLVRIRENAESIAFYGGEENEMRLLLQRFRSAYENLTVWKIYHTVFCLCFLVSVFIEVYVFHAFIYLVSFTMKYFNTVNLR